MPGTATALLPGHFWALFTESVSTAAGQGGSRPPGKEPEASRLLTHSFHSAGPGKTEKGPATQDAGLRLLGLTRGGFWSPIGD